MISIIVCGRNDGYGVDLPKRTAMSLNLLAALCTSSGDEVIYVDCGTPGHKPTLLEAIADTLTPEAIKKIRGFRISEELMTKAIGDTALPLSDELSRNVAIRRSNPENTWILSTNSDVLVHPIGGMDLGALLNSLPPRFYLCPRLGIPSGQWQNVDPANVTAIIEWLDRMIRKPKRFPPEHKCAWLRFGSVGDFQLAPREQWFTIRGCEEAMTLWGHSDANNARRLSILNNGGATPDLGDYLRVYHLDHREENTASAEQCLPQNSWKKWIDDITRYESSNPDDWGLPNEEVPTADLAPRSTPAAHESAPMPRKSYSQIEILRQKACNKSWRKLSAVLDCFTKQE